MAKTFTCQAIILHSYDVGEADRFCILLTKEKGKIAARARGVRKPKSRFGGTLLPFNYVSVQLTEGKAGYLITSALHLREFFPATLNSAVKIQQSVELLLTLLHDEEPVPAIFSDALQFLGHTHNSNISLGLAFMVRTLGHLGLIPNSSQSDFYSAYTNQERAVVDRCFLPNWYEVSPQLMLTTKTLPDFCKRIVEEQSGRVLKAESFIA